MRCPTNVDRLKFSLVIFAIAITAIYPGRAAAFCGFYVGKADASLHNHSSKVVIVRHDEKTVLSIMSDYQGDLSQFAMVVPVPVVLTREQIHIGDVEVFKHLDAYSAPRLVEYDDPSPCPMMFPRAEAGAGAAMPFGAQSSVSSSAKALGVEIKARFTVGEYDIVILSASQSDGLETWLVENGYRIPKGAAAALEPYIRDGMKFFVAKVNLKAQTKLGLNYLRPIQFAFESSKFMLPIRLGMLNASGPQELTVYTLTENGRVETTNYRTVRMPTGISIPNYVRDDFDNVYSAIFTHQAKINDMNAVFTEYTWNMGWCDPCAAPPLSRDELRELGVFWLGDPNPTQPFGAPPAFGYSQMAPTQVILTRLHLRYSPATFPEDLMFQETNDAQNFQTRYVLHRAWSGSPEVCPAATTYLHDLDQRRAKRAQNLADLTGWDLNEIMRRAGLNPSLKPRPWWQGLWN